MKKSNARTLVVTLVALVGISQVWAQAANIPGVGLVVKQHGPIANAANCPGGLGCPPPIADKAAPKKAAIAEAHFLDINTATQAQLAAIPTVGEKAAAIILFMRKSGAFRDSTNLAARVCPQVALNLEETSIQIGEQQIVYRGNGSPKNAGWKCGTAPRTYSVDNKIYKY
jgi:DNA uptake protein ComE-like DNA-binding protein